MSAVPDAPALAKFRELQQLAYAATTEVADGLGAGVTEVEAVQRLEDALSQGGVQDYFHQPFAWFGDRTAFTAFRTPLDFFPKSTRRLEPGMPAILDVAPIVDGYAVDIGYSFSLGDNPVLAQAHVDLKAFRELIVERVSRGDSLGEIYRAVEDLLADLGYRNCHRKYPFGVLAHRIGRVPKAHALHRRVLGFSVTAATGLLARAAASRLPAKIWKRLPLSRRHSPFCNVGPGSEARPEPGLWAFEPHIARGGVGAKWEEILVVEEDRAYWLDDDLPHVRRGEN